MPRAQVGLVLQQIAARTKPPRSEEDVLPMAEASHRNNGNRDIPDERYYVADILLDLRSGKR